MKLGWLSRKLREIERSWWYVGYAYAHNNRMVCAGMVYTLSTQHFVLPSILRDLEKRLGCDTVTILSWQRLNPKEGLNLAKYFQARRDEMLAKDGAKLPHLSLVKIEDEDGKCDD